MKNLLIIIFFLVATKAVQSQALNVVLTTNRITTLPELNTKAKIDYRTIKATVVDGSGDYVYTWGASEPHSIVGEKAANQVTTALNEEDIQYRVFVEDKKTGKMGYATINFNKSALVKPKIHFSVFPNPTANDLTINLEGSDNKKVPVRVELFSERSTIPVRSVEKERLSDNKYIISTTNLPSGTYYVHVQYPGESTPQQVRILINR